MDDIRKTNANTVLVTGGAGFIGSHLTDELANKGMKVLVLDDLSSGNMENVCVKNIEFVQGDVRNTKLTEKLISRSDIIFHLAEYIPETTKYGVGHVVKYSVENPLLDFDVSCRGTLLVLDKARKYDKKIVFTSSAAVYGQIRTSSITEKTPTFPSSPYGASKLCAETYVKLYAKLYGLPTTILRLFNVYGPRQRKYLMHDILLKLENNPKKLEIMGTGLEERDFVYVDDVVDALIYVSSKEEANGEIFNVGTGVAASVKEVVGLILEILDLNPKVTYTQSSWKGDIKKLVANIKRIRNIGFEPKISPEEGLRRLIKWFNTERMSDERKLKQI
jgi:UDP-glucose 4-epimerase